MSEKKCPKCNEVKLFTDFYKNKYSKTNTSPYCKICSNLRTTSYARENKDKIDSTGYALKRRYGITSKDYVTMLESQNGKCAICHSDTCNTGRNLAVDHCHVTKSVRGLLCSSCNIGLGQFKDNISLLKQAITYLERHQ